MQDMFENKLCSKSTQSFDKPEQSGNQENILVASV